MYTQNYVLHRPLHSALPPIQTHTTRSISTLPGPSPSKIASPNCVSLKITPAISSHTLISKRILRCKNSVVVVVEEDNSKAKIRRKNLAVFVSGGCSNFRSIYEAILSGYIHGDIVVLVTNKHDCGGAEYARDKGIHVIVFPKRKDSEEVFSGKDLVIALSFKFYYITDPTRFDFILLAGYLKLIPAELIQAYPKSICNIHPSLLPSFGGKGYYGMKVHKAVIVSGARYSGPTIHYVDEQYDTGRILAQRVVHVLPNDTAEELAARVLHEEHKLYVEVAAALCEERVS